MKPKIDRTSLMKIYCCCGRTMMAMCIMDMRFRCINCGRQKSYKDVVEGR